jgi:hypothetical protein
MWKMINKKVCSSWSFSWTWVWSSHFLAIRKWKRMDGAHKVGRIHVGMRMWGRMLMLVWS